MASVGATGMVWGGPRWHRRWGQQAGSCFTSRGAGIHGQPRLGQAARAQAEEGPPSTGQQWRLLPGQWGCGRPPMKGHSAHVL